jgi:hypothetical protein
MSDSDVGFVGTTPDPVGQGDTLTIHFCNPSLANQTITIDVKDGLGGHETVTMTLDEEGKGTATFTVPTTWTGIILQHESVPDHAVDVG